MTNEWSPLQWSGMKKRLLIAIIPVAVLVAGPWVVPRFMPLSAINRRDQEINIKTGQIRYSRHLWYIKVSERVEDTTLSEVLGGESVDVADIPAWHKVITFSPGLHHSPVYSFTGALHQASDIELLFRLLEPDPQRKERIVRDVLKLWQIHGDHVEADRYLRALSKETAKEIEQRYPEFFPETPSPNAAQPAIEKSENR